MQITPIDNICYVSSEGEISPSSTKGHKSIIYISDLNAQPDEAIKTAASIAKLASSGVILFWNPNKFGDDSTENIAFRLFKLVEHEYEKYGRLRAITVLAHGQGAVITKTAFDFLEESQRQNLNSSYYTNIKQQCRIITVGAMHIIQANKCSFVRNYIHESDIFAVLGNLKEELRLSFLHRQTNQSSIDDFVENSEKQPLSQIFKAAFSNPPIQEIISKEEEEYNIRILSSSQEKPDQSLLELIKHSSLLELIKYFTEYQKIEIHWQELKFFDLILSGYRMDLNFNIFKSFNEFISIRKYCLDLNGSFVMHTIALLNLIDRFRHLEPVNYFEFSAIQLQLQNTPLFQFNKPDDLVACGWFKYSINKIFHVLSTFSSLPNSPMGMVKPFGADEWEHFFDLAIQDSPDVPEKLRLALDCPCPFWPGKLLKETHLLCLVPKELTSAKLWELATAERGGGRAPPSLMKDVYVPNESYWILITKQVLPGTRYKSFAMQKAELSRYKYQVPTMLEAEIAILSMSSFSKDLAIYPGRGGFTRCQEQVNGWPVAIGSDSSVPLAIDQNDCNCPSGVAAVFK